MGTKACCSGREEPGARAYNGRVPRAQTTCGVCGKIKRRNHNCKGAPAGESRPKAQPDERIARELPKAIRVEAGRTDDILDPKLAAIMTILRALDGLNTEQAARMLVYVADRKGIPLEDSRHERSNLEMEAHAK